jgi:hypothetical protein
MEALQLSQESGCKTALFFDVRFWVGKRKLATAAEIPLCLPLADINFD